MGGDHELNHFFFRGNGDAQEPELIAEAGTESPGDDRNAGSQSQCACGQAFTSACFGENTVDQSEIAKGRGFPRR
jgi:hypothetical protein